MVDIPAAAKTGETYVLNAASRIDFSYLELPKVFEDVDYTSLLNDAIAKVEAAEIAAGRNPGQIYESHTFAKLLEAVVYLKELILHRVNEAARAVLISHSEGTDLEALGGLLGVSRQLIEPLPTTQGQEPRWESDLELRRRIALAPERLSLAATLSSYVFFALSANDKPTNVVVEKASQDEVVVRYTFGHDYLAASIVDASAYSPAPGTVVVTIMDRSPSRVPPAATVIELQRRITQPWAKPLTDTAIVRPVTPVPYDVVAAITTYPGVDRSRLLADSRKRLDEYVARQEYIGRDVTLDGLRGAIMGPNIHSVQLTSPLADVSVDQTQVALASSVSLTLGAINV